MRNRQVIVPTYDILPTTEISANLSFEETGFHEFCDITEDDYVQIKEPTVRHKAINNSNGQSVYPRAFAKAKIHCGSIVRKIIRCHGNYPKFGLYSSNKKKIPRWITFFFILLSVILMTPLPSTADYYSDYVSLIMTNQSQSACDGEYLRIDCPEGTSIHVKSAMYGRKVPSSEMCPPTKKVVSADEYAPSGDEDDVTEDLNCEAKTASECEDQRICRLLVHRRVFGEDPCPGTHKYLTVQYQCAPNDFRELSTCTRDNIKFRCRQDTVISIYDVIMSESSSCKTSVNATNCIMPSESVLFDVSIACHAQEKCTYSFPDQTCFSQVKIVYTCVPKELLTSELPSSVRLLATTTTVTSQTTPSSAEDTTVQTTVTTLLHHKGETTASSSTTSTTSEASALNTTQRISEDYLKTSTAIIYNVTAGILTNDTDVIIYNETTTTFNNDVIKNNRNQSERDVIIVHNDFPMPKDVEMNSTASNMSIDCFNCSSSQTGVNGSSSFYGTFLATFLFIQENSEQAIIAVLLGICAALLITVCVLACPYKLLQPKKKEEPRKTTHEDSRDSIEEEYRLAPPPEQEDEHENMSLLGSMLQRSHTASSTTTAHHQISPNSTQRAPSKRPSREEKEKSKSWCGPDSIFAKICCNCCCNNAPWQRTHILKRHRGDVYRVTHRYSSSLEDEEVRGRYHSDVQDSFPVFNRVDENHSPVAVLEDHVNRTEYPIVTSQQNNFRPISRSTQRHYSTTPEPDQPYRTNHTFRPRQRLPSQRSDNAIIVNSTQQRYDVTKTNSPRVTQPTKSTPSQPKIIHTPSSHHAMHTTGHSSQQAMHTPGSPVSPRPMHTPSHVAQQAIHTPSSPQAMHTPGHVKRTKHTPAHEHYGHYDNHHYPTFTEAYEQYDNAQQHYYTAQHSQHQAQPQQYHPHYNTTNQYPPYYNGQNGAYADQFVQAVQRRTVPANARTVDLAANARTVDLSRNNSLSRNSWIEIRRSSIYDNSLPRNSEMYEYYQQLQELQQNHQMHHHQSPMVAQHVVHELPGSRNLNQYYP